MERKQIIKALECCDIGDCEPCPFRSIGVACVSKVQSYALSLIKELTEENERLRGTLEEVTKRIDNLIEKTPIAFDYEKAQAKAATVRKMQDKFVMHFGTYTVKDVVNVLDVLRLVNQIAEEILEEGK